MIDGITIGSLIFNPSDLILIKYSPKDIKPDKVEQIHNYVCSELTENKVITIPDYITLRSMNKDDIKILLEQIQDIYNEK